ncbi:hypothetical protein, partial [Paenibacillus dendritiformis]|uniref:hypothetical protein n=1 Tax=Paenibacillus dendritiformis TaxID=130049 RepID=UPI001EE66526
MVEAPNPASEQDFMLFQPLSDANPVKVHPFRRFLLPPIGTEENPAVFYGIQETASDPGGIIVFWRHRCLLR